MFYFILKAGISVINFTFIFIFSVPEMPKSMKKNKKTKKTKKVIQNKFITECVVYLFRNNYSSKKSWFKA